MNLFERFEVLEDPRDIRGKKYKLIVEIDEDNKIQRKNIYEVDNL